MLTEWLEEYHNREIAESDNFLNQAAKGTFPEGYIYPSKARFPKLQAPFSRLFYDSFWAQIPLYGSSFLAVPALPKSEFLRHFGISDLRDFYDLMDFHKETGRVQFVLSSDPLTYADCDFLESFLREVNPPIATPLPADYFDSSENVGKNLIEFNTIAQFKFVPYLLEHLGGSDSFAEERIFTYSTLYSQLVSFGYTELAQTVQNLLIDNPRDALACLNYLTRLILDPARNPLDVFYHASDNASAELLGVEGNIMAGYSPAGPAVRSSSVVFPYEIGRFLFKKFTALPESRSGCLAVIDKYRQNDVSHLVGAMQEACLANKTDDIASNTKELATALDNIWADANGLKSLGSAIRYGVATGLGAVGAVASQQSLGLGGILAGMGITVADTAFGGSLSERLAKLLSPNYLVTIYDFKERHRID